MLRSLGWFAALGCAVLVVGESACIVTLTNGAGGSGGTGGGGVTSAGNTTTATSGSGGNVAPEGPKGSVGNLCKDDGTCDPNLLCNASKYCQPGQSMLPAQIKQAVPPLDSVKVPSASPILLFTDGTYSNVMFKVVAFNQNGQSDLSAKLVVTKLTTSKAKDIFVLSGKDPFPLGTSVVVTLSGQINGTLVFNVDHQSPVSADGTLGFEGAKGSDTCTSSSYAPVPLGWKGFGDTGAIGPTGSLKPTEGQRLLALSTGEALCGRAIGDTTSIVVSGPMTVGPAGISFDYNFQSSEFDDYCNSEFDDTFLAILAGPKGAVAKIVNSVNMVCDTKMQKDATFPKMPDGGDPVYKETGVLAGAIGGDVGTPAVVAFVVTDVGDSILSTVVGIDNLKAK